ncbi:MAG: hypothetical protein U5R31_16315 [Acidimicrobiia bacterium]|nr:hypothetical protein [Acidimicrobiia bacterium]
MFFTWAARNERADRQRRRISERDLLTWDQVAEEFDRLGPPPVAESEVPTPDRRPPPAGDGDGAGGSGPPPP